MGHASWFSQQRYGMFVHWGPYAVAGRGEWVLNRERIGYEEYSSKYVAAFSAQRYDPSRWCALAREAGMGYIVLTTRHHDGFALWDTETTEFNAVRMGPKRDLVAPYVQAARDAGLRVGLYFSAADWRHPDYPAAYARDWPQKDDWQSEDARKRFVAYYRAQLEELMTRYGTIDLLWYDGCIPQPLDGEETNRRVKELQPGILINERNGPPFDFRCSEQAIKEKEGPWEACMTLNDNWGYHAGDDNWKSARDVIHMLLETSGKGGNLLLNIGPRADGTIPEPSENILRQAGDWLRRNDGFLSSSGRSPFTWNNCLKATVKGSKVYLHLTHDPGGSLTYAEIRNPILSVRWLDGGEPVEFRQLDDGKLVIDRLPSPLPDPIASTLVVEVEGEPEPVTPQGTFWIPE